MHNNPSLSGELFAGGSASALLQLLSGLPVILGFMFLFRGALMWLEAPLLSLLGPRMSWQVGGMFATLKEKKLNSAAIMALVCGC
jgi:hypothetical protein